MLGAAIAAYVLLSFARSAPEHFDDLALGADTQTFFAALDGVPIHCSDLTDLAPCLEGHRARGSKPAIVWFGNSQLHSINQLEPQDETAPQILSRLEREHDLDVLAFSQPNANLQEHLVLFAYLLERLPIHSLVLPLVFDDLRESSVRDDLLDALSDPEVARTLEAYEAGRTILANNRPQVGGDLAALQGTVQQRTESALSNWLDAHWPLWELRPRARGSLFRSLHLLRNTAFGITAQSKRRIVPGRLELNLGAAEAMLQEARRRGIRTIVYVVPLRSDVERPYIASDYESFKRTAEGLSIASGARFADLENLVPNRYWGQGNTATLGGGAEIDFMHFQGNGHQLLAAAIDDILDIERGVTLR